MERVGQHCRLSRVWRQLHVWTRPWRLGTRSSRPQEEEDLSVALRTEKIVGARRISVLLEACRYAGNSLCTLIMHASLTVLFFAFETCARTAASVKLVLKKTRTGRSYLEFLRGYRCSWCQLCTALARFRSTSSPVWFATNRIRNKLNPSPKA